MLRQITDSRGYTAYVDPETGDSIREHQLCAIAAGYDPDEVFTSQVHHLIAVPTDYGVQIDTPTAVVPLSRSAHQQIHLNEDTSISVETVFSVSQ
jgi:hypothetical protein